MGRFVNTDNSAFKMALNSEIYVDKSGLIEYTNRVLNTNQAFICNSRPRRFGKSVTADMLVAYYSKGCDSKGIFDRLEISKSPSYKENINKYDVIHFDVQWCMMDAGSPDKTVNYINEQIIAELKESYSDVDLDSTRTAYGAMSLINMNKGIKFIVIIDEWDVIIRDEAANNDVQTQYINFLRGMFKGSEPAKFIQLAYLTGILPIKRIKTQSALNNFDEYTMISAKVLDKYTGFTEDEVKCLCERFGRDYDKVKSWYDGYKLGNCHIYNPKAVVNVMLWGEYRSYWSETGTYEAIIPLINMNFDGLKTAIIEMIAGASINVDVNSFQNDMVSFAGKDDVMTLLIHLGYLAYDSSYQMAYIPNEEIRQEFILATKKTEWNELIAFQKQSQVIIDATLDKDAATVADCIEKIHTEYTSAIQYNNENSLSCVLSLAYLSAMQYYFKPVREMPTGRGFADIVLLPKPEYTASYPALIIELKWNQDAVTAINQIKEKKYPEAVKKYTDNILLVGINYDKKTKKHSCIIER